MNEKVKKFIQSTYSENPEVIKNPTAYIYDLEEITARITQIEQDKLPNVSLYYAMKANPNEAVMKHVLSHSVVKGIEIASTGELEIARRCGLTDSSRVLFTGPGKTEDELEESVRSKIRFINVESVVEAIRINEIAERLGVEKVDILLRVNINYFFDGASEYMAGKSTKLGMDQTTFDRDYEIINNLEHLNVRGYHVFAADGVLDYNVLVRYTDFVFKFIQEQEEKTGKNVEVIDFGGGFGIDYTKQGRFFDTKAYFDGIGKLVEKYNFEDKELVLELGKYIVGSAGYYTAKIIDIKDCKGEKHIVAAGGINQMRLPVAAERKHPVYIVEMNEPKVYEGQPEICNETVDVEGPLCMTEDLLSWDEFIESAKIGDIVVLTQAGAYCYSDSTLWFLSHPLPFELILE